MVDNETKEEIGESEDTGEGDKPTATDTIERQSKRIEELEKAAEERAVADAKKQLGGDTEGGSKSTETKKETPHEYRTRINKELDEGKTEFGN